MRFLLIFTLFYTLQTNAQEEIHESRLTPYVSEGDTTRFVYDQIITYHGSSTDLDPHFHLMLEYLLELMDENPTWTIQIRGHVCCGPAEKVSEKRAKKVYEYLLEQGLSAERMTYKGYSDRMPLAYPELTPEDEERNRSVDFLINK